MRIIGLISDTHIPTRAKAVPEKALDAFKDSSLIIHVADLIQLSVLSINPESPTNPLPPFLVKPTIAQLRITKEKIEPEIIRI